MSGLYLLGFAKAFDKALNNKKQESGVTSLERWKDTLGDIYVELMRTIIRGCYLL